MNIFINRIHVCWVPYSPQNTSSLFIERHLHWKWFAKPNSEVTSFFMGFINCFSWLKNQVLSSLKCYTSVFALFQNYVWFFINLGFKKALMEKTWNVVLQKTQVHFSKDHFSDFQRHTVQLNNEWYRNSYTLLCLLLAVFI